MTLQWMDNVDGIDRYRLSNESGMEVDIITYGGRITRLVVPDKAGNPVDVVLGFDDPADYRGDNPYFGALIGRVGNRIDKGRFSLNGKEYCLALNDGLNHLHGGAEGFDRKIWKALPLDSNKLELTYVSPDGEEGYPGNLKVTVTYTLGEDNSLKIDYEATSDADTPLNLTNHAYFNLNGDAASVGGHIVEIASDALTDVDEGLIPHGELLPLKGTPLDFGTPHPIGRHWAEDHRLLKIARGGYDFNYVLSAGVGEPVATAVGDKSGISMEVYTDRPCLQFYTGNFLDGVKGKQIYPYHSAFCMETQGYPNAVNVPAFPSCVLKAGETFRSSSVYKFGIAK